MKKVFYMLLCVASVALIGCKKDNNEPEPDQKENGHEYVDLGLSVKWATMNVGATTPEGYGDYFAWGETSTKSSYPNENYTYTDKPTTLPLSADAANVNWGGNWRMPTYAELNELKDEDNCTWEWKTNYNSTGVNGYLVTSKMSGYTDKSIFLPAAGYYNESGLNDASSVGQYWSSSLSEVFSALAHSICFTSSNKGEGNYDRYHGQSVRAVCP